LSAYDPTATFQELLPIGCVTLEQKEEAEMTFDPSEPVPPNRNGGNVGAFGLIAMIAAIAIGAYYWLGNRPATPDQVETTGSAPPAIR
jgi:hypothetical protein